MSRTTPPPIEQVLGSAATIGTSRIEGEGPDGHLPLDAEMLRHEPSDTIFGLTQNAGMGWRPALGYHTGHWEIGLLVRGAAEALRAAGAIPFAVYCSDPCDGRTQGTTGMFDSLAYRNDAAIVMRRLNPVAARLLARQRADGADLAAGGALSQRPGSHRLLEPSRGADAVDSW